MEPQKQQGLSRMSAQIIDLAEARARTTTQSGGTRLVNVTKPSKKAQPSGKERFHFWTGASGARYVHTVYDLLTCPTLPASNFMLIKRDKDGEPEVLSIGQLSNSATSLNLAEVRRKGAELGATEVHVHLLADDTAAARQVQNDLQTGHLNTDWQNEKTAWAH